MAQKKNRVEQVAKMLVDNAFSSDDWDPTSQTEDNFEIDVRKRKTERNVRKKNHTILSPYCDSHVRMLFYILLDPF